MNKARDQNQLYRLDEKKSHSVSGEGLKFIRHSHSLLFGHFGPLIDNIR